MTQEAIEIANIVGGNVYDGKTNTYYKRVDGKLIGKPSVQCKRKDNTTYIDWFETCDKDLIDKTFYNLDGTRK